MDTEIKSEFDNVSPEAELNHLDKEMEKLIAQRRALTKKLADLTTADPFTLEIVLKDKGGKVQTLVGNDGSKYDKIIYENVTSKNLRSLLVSAGIGLMTAVPNVENLGLRYGGELNRLNVQERQYEERRARARELLAERKRKEQGDI